MHKHTVSFINAGRGIWTAITTQSNIRIHFVVGSLVLFAAVYLRLSLDHLIDLLISISLVVVAEMINTAIEFASDAITLDHNPNIKLAKDVSAGAVLFAAFFAAIIGIITFLPSLLNLFRL